MGKLGTAEYELLIDAMVTGDPSGAIERQEARGQQALVRSEMLPAQCVTPGGWEILEALGLKRGDPVDDLFVQVTLPEGWTKAATDHSMWSELRDERGRTRGGIFYKAACYDRKASFNLKTRFRVGMMETGTPDRYSYIYAPMDGEKVLFVPDVAAAGSDEYEQHGLSEKLSADWLDERYPDWKNPAAYWGD